MAFHNDINEINFWPVDLDRNISFGHIKYEREWGSPYEDPFTVANIRYDKTLNRCWRRFVCCKEMMHVFDEPDERVNSAERFRELLAEFESPPLEADVSAMYNSENKAQWMALLVLCPQRLRDHHRAQIEAGSTEYEVALSLKIPEAYIRAAVGDYYDRALALLLAP